MKRRQNESGVLRGGKSFHREQALTVSHFIADPVGFVTESIMVCKVRQDGFAKFLAGSIKSATFNECGCPVTKVFNYELHTLLHFIASRPLRHWNVTSVLRPGFRLGRCPDTQEIFRSLQNKADDTHLRVLSDGQYPVLRSEYGKR